MNILFDSWSTQVLYQQAPPSPQIPPGMRLNTILGAMKSYGLSTKQEWNISFTTPPITKDQLTGVDVYVSLTRYIGERYAYEPDELALLKTFVYDGGGILLMTNHGGLKNDDWTENDAALANQFGIQLQNYYVTTDNYMVMNVNQCLPSPYNYLGNQAPTISAHDACIILPPADADFVPLVCFPPGATAHDFTTGKTIKPPPSPYFSILLRKLGPEGNGEVIVVGNSGFVGDYGSTKPAAGLITMEHNLMFFLNCVGYLGGLTCIPNPGQAPCANPGGAA